MRSRVQRSSNQICQMLQEVHPSYYSIHSSSNLLILCQSPDDTVISRKVSQFLLNSTRYYLQNLDKYPPSGSSSSSSSIGSSKEWHKTKIANMLLSCREYIQENQISGSCMFGLCYFIKNQLFCFRTQGIEIFLFNQEFAKVRGVNARDSFGDIRRQRNKGNYYLPFFSINMPKIKTQFMYDQTDPMKRFVYSQYVDFDKLNFPKQGLSLLIGCSETFDLLTPQFIFKYFKENSHKNDYQKVSGILEEAKKKSKSVQRQDLSLHYWRINPSHTT